MSEIQRAIREAAGREEVQQRVERVYEEVGRRIEQRRPVCAASGRCCRFEEYGHRLFVSTLEMACFVRQSPERSLTRDWDGRGCPFQANRLCTVHAIRPFGCRMFYCDPSAEQWQQEQYEAFHAELKRLHEELGVPYFYLEWRQALREVLGLEAAGDGAGSNSAKVQ